MKRSGAAAVVVVSAALVAAGCGSESGSSSAAKDAKALDFVPKNALGYATIDLDFEGDNWKQFEKLAGAFTEDFDLDKEIADLGSEGDEKTDYKKDIEPWLGDNAGAAVTSIDRDGEDAEAFAWIELKDRAKFEDFAKDEGFKKDGSAGDFDLWTKDDDTFAVSDDLAITGDDKAQITKVVEFDGDSITEVDGIDGVIDELEGDGLATIVLSGDGVRDWIKKDKDLKALANNKQLKEFDGAAVSFAAEDEGFRLRGVSKGGTEGTSNGGTDVLRGLPGNTVVALGGNDLGGGIKSALDAAGESDASVQSAVAQLSGVLGVEVKELETAFDGEFVFGISGEDDGLQSLVGTVAGAAMGGGMQGVNPGALTKSGAVTLAFEANDDTAATLDKITGSIGGLTGGAAPKTGTAGDFETKTMNVAGLPVTAASKDDVAAISIGTDVFTEWGSSSLGDNDAFKNAWDAAGAPKDVAVSFWADFPRVAKMIDLKSKDGMTAGGWVGFGEADGGDASFELFMHVDES